MPSVYQIRFTATGETQEYFGSRGDYYELRDGTQIDVRSQPIWCRRCGGFTDGESIERLEEIDQQIADLEDPRSELYRFARDTRPTPDGVLLRPHFTELLKRRRQWLMRPGVASEVPRMRLDRDRRVPYRRESRESDRPWLGRDHDHGPLQHVLQQPLLPA